MSEQPHYSMLIQWSNEDRSFLVTLPEWAQYTLNPVTHGTTYEDAATNGREALDLLIESRQTRGLPLPEAQMYANLSESAP